MATTLPGKKRNGIVLADKIIVKNDSEPLLSLYGKTSGELISQFTLTAIDLNKATSVKGNGTTSATTAFLVKNNVNTELFKILDDGTIFQKGVDIDTKFGTPGVRNLIGNNIYTNGVAGYHRTNGRPLISGFNRFNFSREANYDADNAKIKLNGTYSISFWYKVENYVSGTTLSVDINDRVVGSTVLISSNLGWTFWSSTVFVNNYVGLFGFLDIGGTFNSTVTISDVVVVRGTQPLQEHIPAPEDFLRIEGGTLQGALTIQGALSAGATVIKGVGTTSGTTALSITSSTNTELVKVEDGGTVRITSTTSSSSTTTGALIVSGGIGAAGIVRSVDFSVDATNGKGYSFWNSTTAYKIYMSTSADGTWGGRMDAVSDYNMYFRMSESGTNLNRGWVFTNTTIDGTRTPAAQIDGLGNLYLRGKLNASSLSGTVATANLPANIAYTDIANLFTNSTESTSATTGALRVTGGVGIGGNAHLGGGLVVHGSLNSGGSNHGGYRNTGTNIILKGNASGNSGIFFESEKDGTNINHPSDYGFIQFHSYGLDGSTGENNRLVIGVANDSTDKVVLQSPYIDGVAITYQNATSGTAMPEYAVLHDGNATLARLIDTTITSPVVNQLVRHDGTRWVNWTPNYLTSYSETDTLDSVVARNSVTTRGITIGSATIETASTHVSGDLSTANAALRLYNNLQSNNVGDGSHIVFESNFEGTPGVFTRGTRAAIKGGTSSVGNTANGFLAFYTDSASSNSITERMRIDHNGHVTITGNTTANSFVKTGGTSAQFLKADGSVDANVYALASRTITASTGLTGGGDLTANRTFSVDFGTTAGKVSEGNHTHPNGTQTVAGFLSTADKIKLDGIAANANNYTHPAYTTQTPTLTGANVLATFTSDATGHVTALTTRTLAPSDIGAQVTLISGTNIKTINGATLLGSGDLVIPAYTHPTYTAQTPTLSGANVLATFATDASGHVTALTTRALTAADIGASATTHVHKGEDITTGTVADARLSSNVAFKNAVNTFTATNTFNSVVNVGDRIAASTSSVLMEGVVLDLHPESNNTVLPFISNDLAYMTKRGGAITTNWSTTASQREALVDGSPSYAFFSSSSIPPEGAIIEMTFHKGFNYGSKIGVSFGSSGWRAKSIKVEMFRSDTSVWETVADVTNWGKPIMTVSIGTSGFNYTQMRWTFNDFNNTIFRIAQIWLLNYNSTLSKEVFVGRDGGAVYGSLSLTDSLVADTTVKSLGNLTAGGFDFIFGNTDQTTRGNSGSSRAMVKYLVNSLATLCINYGNDFPGGVNIQSALIVDGVLNAKGGLQENGVALSSRYLSKTSSDTMSGALTSNGNIVVNTANTSASVSLNFTTGNVPRLRIGGSGVGSNDEFQIQGVGDFVRFGVDSNGNSKVPGSSTANSFVKTGGTSAQFLKADGSVDTTAYQPAGSYQVAGDYVQRTTNNTVSALHSFTNGILLTGSNYDGGVGNFSSTIGMIGLGSVGGANGSHIAFFQQDSTYKPNSLMLIAGEGISGNPHGDIIFAREGPGWSMIIYGRVNGVNGDFDWSSYAIKGNSFVKTGGTSAQFLKADGSVDANVYALASRTITASTGLTGGGDLTANRTFSVDFGTTAGKVSEGNHTHPNGTQTVAGFLSTADKIKLDGIAADANNYSHPTGFTSQPGTALSGANVISQVTVNTNGHVTGVTSRTLGASDIGAQATLVSGTNIKTINGTTLLGSGDLVIPAYSHPTGFTSQPATALTNADVISQVTINTNGHVSGVVTRTLTAANIGAQVTLVSGTNIKTINGTTILGTGDISIPAYTHPAYTSRTPTLTGANVLATFTSDATGHVTALTTRTLTASDIGAQATLVSGTNIKTINGTSILGTGDISITPGGTDTLDTVTTRNPSTTNDISTGLITGTRGNSKLSFNQGSANLTPTLYIMNTNVGGKAAALFSGTNYSSFVFDSAGYFTISSETKANFSGNILGSGTNHMTVFNNSNIGIGATPTDSGARLTITGSGTTSATTNFLARNSSNSELFKIQDNGTVTLSTLGAGFVRTSASGVLSSSALVAGDLPAHTHSNGTQTVAGFLSTADKIKLDGIAADANNYSHPTGFTSQPGTALTNADVISQVTVNTNGHVSGVVTRTLTAANIGAQATLVSGTNIKTINGNSILGTGDLVISGGSVPPNVAYKDSNNFFTTQQTIQGNINIQGDGNFNFLTAEGVIRNAQIIAGSFSFPYSNIGVGGTVNGGSSMLTVFGNADINTSLAVGGATHGGRFNVKGSGTTSGTTTMLIQNSASTELFSIKDNGQLTVSGPSELKGATTITTNGLIGNPSSLIINNSNNQNTLHLNDYGSLSVTSTSDYGCPLVINSTANALQVPLQELRYKGTLVTAIYNNGTSYFNGMLLNSPVNPLINNPVFYLTNNYYTRGYVGNGASYEGVFAEGHYGFNRYNHTHATKNAILKVTDENGFWYYHSVNTGGIGSALNSTELFSVTTTDIKYKGVSILGGGGGGGSYTHPTYTAQTPTLTGANVLATFTSDASGHVTALTTRTLAASDIGAQATLVSGTNIKTINGATLLGSGDISIPAYTHPAYTSRTPTLTGANVLATFTSDATGHVTALTTRTLTSSDIGAQETLISGTNIKTINGVSILGSGNLVISGGGGVGGPPNTNNTLSNTAITINTTETVLATVTITPSSLDSAILLAGTVDLLKDSGTPIRTVTVRLKRDGVVIGRDTVARSLGTATTPFGPVSLLLRDLPNTTAQVTYTMVALTDGGSPTAPRFVFNAIEASVKGADGEAGAGGGYTHPTYTARTPTLTGANVLATFTSDATGHVTALTTRTLAASDIGAQATLVSGTNIKTINGATLLGTGDISIPTYSHPGYTARTPTLTGANVLATFTSDATGHVTALTTRTLAASDIGAQATLVSGTNIKTINGNSILGTGDLVISGGGYTHPTYTAQTPTLTGANVLATFSSDATGHITALTTRTLAASDIGAQATLVSGTNIKTINGASILGTGDIVITGGSGLSTAYLSTRALNNADDGDAAGVTAHFLTSGAINKPTGENFSLLTLSYDADWATQLAGDWRTNKFHTRTQTTGAWTSWQTLATESWVTANFSGGGGGGTVTSVDTAAANNGVTATWTNTTTTPRLTIGLGIITPTRVRLTSSIDPGIEFGSASGNAKINSVDNNNLILRASSLRIGMGTAGWNYDEWAGIKWDNPTRTLFIGGPQAGATYWAKNGGDLNDTTVNFVGMLNDGLKVNGNKVFHGGNLGNFNQNTTGLVPAPIGTYSGRYLREDGTWQTVGAGGSGLSTAYLSGRTANLAGDATSDGVSVYYLASTATDKPANTTDQALFTLAYDSNWAVQLAGDWRTNKFYTRTKNNGSWTSTGGWKALATEEFVLANSGSGGGSQTLQSVTTIGNSTTNKIIINRSNTHLQFQEGGVDKWHVESYLDEFAIVKTGVVQMVRITNTAMTVAGQVYTTNTHATSDLRLKTNIKDLEYGLEDVLKLRSVSFERKANLGLREVGVIAQEIQKVIPELVSSSDEGTLSVNYAQMTSVLIKSDQDLNTKITEQQKEIDALKEELNEIKMFLKNIK